MKNLSICLLILGVSVIGCENKTAVKPTVPPAVGHTTAPAGHAAPPAAGAPTGAAEEKKEEGDAPKEALPAGTPEVKPETETPKADAKHPVAHKKDEPIHPGFHKADKTVEPRGKKFYILMAVSVLMIGAVCSAFILGKKKE